MLVRVYHEGRRPATRAFGAGSLVPMGNNCDNLPIGKAYSIGVTTYAFSAESAARQAVRLIRARVAGDASPPVKVLIPGELIVREDSSPSALR